MHDSMAQLMEGGTSEKVRGISVETLAEPVVSDETVEDIAVVDLFHCRGKIGISGSRATTLVEGVRAA